MSTSMLKNSFFNVLKNVLTLLFPILTFSYASRILMPEGMGQIDFSKSLMSILIMISMLGMRHYGTRECARVRNNKEQLSKTFKELLLINFVTTLIAYLVLLFIFLFFEKAQEYKLIVMIYSLLIMLNTIGVEWLYTALEDFKYIALRTCGVQVVSLILMLIFVRDEDDVWIYAVIQVLSSGGSYIFGFFHSRKFVDYKQKCKLEIKKHIKPMMLLFMTGAFIEIYVSLDSVMLGSMTSDRYVGYYSSAYKVSSALCSIILAILQVMVPRISYYAEHGLIDELKSTMKKAFSFTLMLDIPISIGAFMLSDYLVIILSGTDFIAATSASKVLALRMLVGPINFLLIYNLFVPIKKDIYAVIVTSAAAITDIVVNLLLIPKMNHTGAAVSTVAAEVVIFIIGMILSRKLIDFSEPFKKIWQYIIAAVPIVPICYFLSLIDINDIVYVLLSVAISAAVYFTILLAMKNELIFEFWSIVKRKIKSH